MLYPYMVGEKERSAEDPSYLVFALDWTDARRVAVLNMRRLGHAVRVYDVDIRRLVGDVDHLRAAGDPTMLLANISHFVKDPPRCSNCNLWGPGKPDEHGRCPHCSAHYKMLERRESA